MYAKSEHHPWMKGFTVMTILTGIGCILFGLFGLTNATSADLVLYTLGIAAFGGVLIYAGRHVLQVTDGFKRWSQVSQRDQMIGYLTMIPGVYVSIFIAFIPIAILAALKAEFGRKT